ncbi:MAG TPA: flagellar biosynthesis protein FlgJ [Prevotella sp.]|nr:flagellar biosynthesis protein FlgJ [Prevotella sp.]
MKDQQKIFCCKVYAAALALYHKDKANSVSPVFTTAQAMLESGWGNSTIGNNLFGMTVGSNWKGKKVLVTTHEVFQSGKHTFVPPERVLNIVKMNNGCYNYKVQRYFRDYNTLEDGLMDHNELFKKPLYADAWPYRLYAKEFAKRISDYKGARYATDPNYYKTLWSLINMVQNIVK